MENMAKILIALGGFLLLAGAALLLAAKLNITGFKLPGDIFIKKEGFTFYFPLMTCLLVSLILSILFNFFSRR